MTTPPIPPTPPAPTPPAPPVPAPPPAPTPQPPAPPASDPAQDVASLPEWAQKLIKDTREEAAANRVGKTEVERQHQAALDGIATALGLKKTETDPAKLTEQLAASQADARRRTVELEVFRQAPAHQGDPAKLLDSRRFMEQAAGLDPAAGDFGGRLAALIKTETDANAHLKLGAAVTSFDGGPRPPDAQLRRTRAGPSRSTEAVPRQDGAHDRLTTSTSWKGNRS